MILYSITEYNLSLPDGIAITIEIIDIQDRVFMICERDRRSMERASQGGIEIATSLEDSLLAMTVCGWPL